MRKKKLETKETRETEREMWAPARQRELAPAPWGEAGCCPCCPDCSSMAVVHKGGQIEVQWRNEKVKGSLVQGGMKGFALEGAELLRRICFGARGMMEKVSRVF